MLCLSPWTSNLASHTLLSDSPVTHPNEDVSLSAQKKSNIEKENPFAISVGPITRSRSTELIENIACFVQNQEIEGELLGQTTITPTTVI